MPRRTPGPPPRSWLAAAPTFDKTPSGWSHSPFGKHNLSDKHWAQGKTDAEKSLIAAARQQHLVALNLRTAINHHPTLKIEDVAVACDMSVDHLRHLLNGSAHLTITDLFRIAGVLDRRVKIATGRKDIPD